MLRDPFKIQQAGSTLSTEVLGGVTTFATTVYIISVQPVVLGAAGMDRGAVFTSTCLITAFATILMAMMANYPVTVAPAMGHNFFCVCRRAGDEDSMASCAGRGLDFRIDFRRDRLVRSA